MIQPSPSEYCESCSASQTPKTITASPPTAQSTPAAGASRSADAEWRSLRSASAIARNRPTDATIVNAAVTCRKRSVEYPICRYRIYPVGVPGNRERVEVTTVTPDR